MTQQGSDPSDQPEIVASGDSHATDTPATEASSAPATDALPEGRTTETGTAASGEAIRPGFVHRPGRHGVVGPFSGAQLVVAALVVAAVAVALVVLTMPLGSTNGLGPPDPRPTPYLIGQPTEGLRTGDIAPELAVAAADGSTKQLTDLAGRPISLASLRGRAVWIDFWASWCPPCQAETPVLRDTYAAYRDRGLDIVAISVQESSPNDVQSYAQRYGLQYTIGFDASGDIFRKYRIYALPTQLFIDPEGVVRYVVQGPLDPTTAAYYVEQILPRTSAIPTGSGSGDATPSGVRSPMAGATGSTAAP